ncbi:MAG: aminotransferase [Betaproteobacteria bacterium RIFCSPLOWO2_02_FULL_67_26]|nr:MAG: aminotransferase [Betaproteobacteria bacterium RIFCSPLOWO2_02_FULL_67_26]
MTPTPSPAARSELAIHGGEPVRAAPLPPWPQYAQDELDAVRNVLASGKVNYWTGQEGAEFEKEYAAHVGCRYAVALSNGSVALELALHALGVGPGADVVVTSRSFIASASCAVLRGARPVFADVDPASQNLSAGTVSRVLTPATRAIIVVHLAGWPCDMDPLLELARPRGIAVIEDCAQSHGATYKGRVTGSLGDAAAFSFCQDKIISTGGEGGMLLTNDRAVWERAWSYKDHGKSYDAMQARQRQPENGWVHESFGTNGRMTEMQAAIGRRQLVKLAHWLELRRRNARLLDAALAGVPGLAVHVPPPGFGHAYYKYCAFLDPARLRPGWDLHRVVEAINAEGIGCVASSVGEIYLEKAFVSSGLAPAARLPNARRLAETGMIFMVHPTLAERDIRDTGDAIVKVMSAAAA